ncbi:MAG: flavin monoamine oxidase family protein [Ilumatobacteraceae bacterium]
MQHDVIVIGAGLAGLRCAADLAVQGLDVVVLEARDRVGGRVFSHTFSNGQTCERGAEFIDGNHTEALALAADLGLRLTERPADIDWRRTLVDAGGRAVPMSLHASLGPDWERWEQAVATLQPNDEFEQATLGDLLHGLGLSVMARVVIGRDIRTEYMLPPEEISQRFAAQVVGNQVAGQRELHRVVGGNDLLAKGLADRLGDRVRLSSPVAEVHAATGEVRLVDGAVLQAGAVVAAVPLPVLSRMWQEMPLELGAVSYGIGGKISVQFTRRVWLDYGRSGLVLSDRSWGHLWETTDDQPGDTGVLTNLLASHDGAAFAALPESTDRIVSEIDRIFPGAKGLAGERVHTDWTNDPYSLGCYTCFGPGQWTAAQPALHTAHDRLWLAGEHADGYAGFMEGALRSGARIAAAITR